MIEFSRGGNLWECPVDAESDDVGYVGQRGAETVHHLDPLALPARLAVMRHELLHEGRIGFVD